MNIRNNKRRKDTVEIIERVFFEQLKTKELYQISVTTICKEADINRSTFYAIYTDVYDLADKIKKQLEDEVNSLVDTDSWSQSTDNFLRLFEHIKQNQELYSIFFKLGFDDGYNLKLYDLCKIDLLDSKYIDYHVEFFKNGFNAIVKKWLKNNCSESPQEMCEILLSEYSGRHKY